MRLDNYLSKYSELKALHDLVDGIFATRGLVHHNWNHVLRDLARAVQISEAEGADARIVLAAVLLHDIGRLHHKEGEDHYTSGARVAPRYLKEAGFSGKEIGEIVHCIRSHGPRGLEEPVSLEERVCYDVDVLSCSCGTLGVARVFHYFLAEEKLTVKGMMEIPSGRKGSRRDFYTRTGRRIGEEGCIKATEFWRGLAEELREEEERVKGVIPHYEGD